jgi:polysaccharide biosynthesis transport protein
MTGPIGEKATLWQVPPAMGPTREVISLDPARAFRALRRQWAVIAIAAVLGGGLALLNALGTVSRYDATVTILLDQERSELLHQVSALPNTMVTDAAIQSEMEIIRSRALALAVVDALGLHEDPVFLDPPIDASTRITNQLRALASPLLGGSATDPAAQDTAQAIDPVQLAREEAASILLKHVKVERIDRSFVMRVTYTGFDAQRTAMIARSYGEEYTRFQLAGTTEIAINAGEWIRERLDVMERRNIEAASAVQRFRLENNLLQARGDLLSEQQQSELASALVEAATQTAALQAELESYEQLLTASSGEIAAVAAMQAEGNGNNPMVELRREYTETRRSLSRVTAQAGEDHPQAIRLRTALAALDTDIALALEGTVATVRARYNIARSREASLRQELAAITDAGRGTENVGQLAQLEATAQTYAQVYADYLRRFETTMQQQGFPIASVQILSDAEVPRQPSSPRKLRLMAAGIFMGALLGLILAALREMRTAPLRTAGEVVAQCGLPCVGLIPRNADPNSTTKTGWIAQRTATRIRQEIDRKAPLATGRIVGLAAVDADGDVGSVAAALCRAMAARSGRVKLVDAGGLDDAARIALMDVENLEIVPYEELQAALYEKFAPRPNDDALSAWREQWPYTVIVMPPLTQAVIHDQATSMLDATVLTITWGKVPPGLLTEAMRDHRDFRAGLAATVLDSANLRGARRYLGSDEYEARLIHA